MMSTAKEVDKGRRSAPLTQQRIDKLNELGFTWTIRSRDALGESWQQRFEELKQYKAEHGVCFSCCFPIICCSKLPDFLAASFPYRTAWCLLATQHYQNSEYG
jgi:hypothetical protein